MIRASFLLPFGVTLAFLSACGPSQAALDATATKDAVQTSSAQTAAAPTSNKIPSPSVTATLPPTTPMTIVTPAFQGLPLTPVPTPVKYREIAKDYLQVHYCTDGEDVLQMEIYIPNELKRDPAPVIINTGVWIKERDELLERGYIVASVPWREPPSHYMPTGLEDAKCAVRYFRANATTWHVDPDRIGAWGCSRGGYMAALLGLTDVEAGMEGTGGFAEESSRLQAVVVLDGVADLKTSEVDIPYFLGIKTSFDEPLVSLVSPVTHASKDDPPFLVIVSEGDNSVPPGEKSQMQQLSDALEAAGVPVTFQEVDNAGHCGFNELSSPTPEEMAEIIGDFFDRTLR